MRFAELQSDQAPSYAYLFTWPSPVMGGAFGSIHGLDLPFMWSLDNDPGLAPLIGDLTTAKPLSTMFQDALLAYAHTGDPSTQRLLWPSYATASLPSTHGRPLPSRCSRRRGAPFPAIRLKMSEAASAWCITG